MTNEYGAKLDGKYAPSIIQSDHSKCYICGRTEGLQRHEPFNGANRTKSQNLGMWVTLCYFCHDMCHKYPEGFGEAMKRETQSKAMKYYDWDRQEWHRRFGKSVL